ncbi:MAG TPA: hypothetical protein VM865_08620 [Acidobacteriaceae bacterium]|jgi:hypothetical protein|nr:hypothetical protein [Acidobacteriaceae bacterium]
MADQLYLSLWFPNFRLQSLPSALVGVLRQFAAISRDGAPGTEFTRVVAASAYPIDWTESPIYQRIFVNDERSESSADTDASLPENAVAEATEQLHDDTAYEFEMRWRLWVPELTPDVPGEPPRWAGSSDVPGQPTRRAGSPAGLDTQWRLEPSRVRIVGFGPDFDLGSYEQNGHIRVDFGLDTPWTFEGQPEDEALDEEGAKRVQSNVEKLLAFTLLVEKHCGISSRLLWTESGEPLAEKLIARLQRLN